MAFPPQFLDELRTRLSLAEVIGRKTRLTRKGREFHGLCPFHNERTPSFTVNEEKGFYHCFGCGAHGDAIAFEMQAHHLSFPEAVERLAGEAGLAVPVMDRAEQERARRQASLHDALEAATQFFQRQLSLPGGSEALAYLRRRGLDETTIARFRLGWAPEGRHALKTALLGGEMPDHLLVEAGLLIAPEGGGQSFDRFRGRVIFPITDRRGRVIAFGGRLMGEGQPKYLNSPDTPLFHKGRVLYGLAQARMPAAEAGTVIVCEGYMDVIALAQAGFAHAVAPLGTAVTEQQIEELWKLAPEPVLCLDGDAAGQRAAARAAERALPLLKPGRSLRFASVPPPEDPDSLIRANGPQAMQAILDKAQPLFEVIWRLDTEGRSLETPERRAALEQALTERVAQIQDATVRFHYQRLVRDRLWQTLRPPRPEHKRSFAQGRSGQRNNRFGQACRPAMSEGGAAKVYMPAVNHLERVLLAVVLTHPNLLDHLGERLGTIHFSDLDLDKLRQEVLKHLGAGPDLDSEVLQSHLRSCGFSRALDSLLGINFLSMEPFVRASAPAERALNRWEDAFKLYQQRDMTADILRAENCLAKDVSNESWERYLALKQQAQDNDWDDGETPA